MSMRVRTTLLAAWMVGGAFALTTLEGCGGTITARETTPVHVVAVAPRPAPPPPEPHRRVAMESARLRVDDSILFETNSAVIDSASDSLLREIADEINAHSESGPIRVEGHTDRRGSARMNRDLSRRRAEAVVERLVELGVPRDRLDSQGLGFAQPIADNETDEGRARNRRVEFILVNADSGQIASGGK